MLNLYTNAIDENGFMGLVSKNVNSNKKVFERTNRQVITTFAVMSLVVIASISNGTKFQLNAEMDKVASLASYTTTT